MTWEEEMALYDYMDDIHDRLENVKERMYTNDNERADRNCPKIYQMQKDLRKIMDEYTGFIEEL